MARIKERLGKLLLVSSNEWPVLLTLMTLSAVVVGANIIGMSSAVSLFLKRVGVDKLPYMYPLSSLTILAFSPLYFKVVDKLPRRVVLLSCYGVFALLPLLMRTLLNVPGGLYLLFVLANFSAAYGTMQFWLIAADLVETRAAKRLFGLVNFGGSAGALVFGMLVRPLSHALRSENLLFLWSAMLAVCWVMLWNVFRRYEADYKRMAAAPRSAPDKKPTLKQDLTVLRRIPVFASMAAIVCLMEIVGTFLDFQYNTAAQAAFHSEEALSSFFGTIYGVESCFAFVIQLTILGRLVSWLGVVNILILHPFILMMPGLGLLLRPGLVSAASGRLSDHIIDYTLYSTATNAIYGAVPAQHRGRLLVFLKVFVAPICVALTGVFIVLAQRGGLNSWLIPTMLGLIVLWIGVAFGLRKRYVATLMSNLTTTDDASRLESLTALQGAGQDPQQIVRHLLKSGDEELATFGLELAKSLQTAPLAEDIALLLSHPSVTMRLEALKTLGGLGMTGLSHAAAGLSDVSPQVRAATVDMWKELDAQRFEPLAGERARVETDPRVLARLLSFLIFQGLLLEEHRRPLLEKAASSAIEDRRFAATALEGLTDADLSSALLLLLEDPDNEVRLLATLSVSAAPGRSPRITARLLSGLCTPAGDKRPAPLEALAQEACERGLVSLGEFALAEVTQAYRREDLPPAVRRQLLRVLGGINSASAHRFLMDCLDTCRVDEEIHVVGALAAGDPLKLESSEVRQGKHRIEESILRSVNRAMDEALTLDSLRKSPDAQAVDLLTDEAHRSIGVEKHLIFEKLSMLVDSPTLASVRSYLQAEGRDQMDAREANLAIELFENLLSLHIRAPVLALMNCPSWEEMAAWARARHGAPREFTSLIESRLDDPDPWLRACAAYAAGKLRLSLYQKRLESLADDPDPVVSETCRAALEQWDTVPVN